MQLLLLGSPHSRPLCIGLLLMLASACYAQTPTQSMSLDRSSFESAIVISKSSPSEPVQERQYIEKNFPDAQIPPGERSLTRHKRHWYDVQLITTPNGQREVYFDVTALHPRSALALEKHIMITSKVPEYAYEARRQHWEGRALLKLSVRADGTVSEVKLLTSTGHQILDKAAIRAGRGWRFRPEASPFIVKLPTDFRMKKSE